MVNGHWSTGSDVLPCNVDQRPSDRICGSTPASMNRVLQAGCAIRVVGDAARTLVGPRHRRDSVGDANPPACDFRHHEVRGFLHVLALNIYARDQADGDHFPTAPDDAPFGLLSQIAERAATDDLVIFEGVLLAVRRKNSD